jgi:hypothetical protein
MVTCKTERYREEIVRRLDVLGRRVRGLRADQDNGKEHKLGRVTLLDGDMHLVITYDSLRLGSIP